VSRTRPHTLLSPFWLRLVLLLRVVSLILGLQLSGAAHLVEDAVSLVVAGQAEHDEQCPADGPCNDCPPGCPQCHCPNALRSVAPLAAATVVLALPASTALVLVGREALPPSPVLPAPFRPPRTNVVS
jgi:hypothetical protein